MKKVLSLTIMCRAYYNAEIELPEGFEGNYKDALKYARAHLEEIPIDELEYIPNSDVLDEDNCELYEIC